MRNFKTFKKLKILMKKFKLKFFARKFVNLEKKS